MVSRTIGLFGEDEFHEKFVRSLVTRLRSQAEVDAEIISMSVRQGLGKTKDEFKQYLRRLKAGKEIYHDALVVAADCNCRGRNDRLNEIRRIHEPYPGLEIVYALPDPHIERWMLMDSQAFRSVFSRPCRVPVYKCERDHYKTLLNQAIRASGREPILGGIEFVPAIVEALDLERTVGTRNCLARFVSDLRALFGRWAQSDALRIDE